jgi:hypothetical protein
MTHSLTGPSSSLCITVTCSWKEMDVHDQLKESKKLILTARCCQTSLSGTGASGPAAPRMLSITSSKWRRLFALHMPLALSQILVMMGNPSLHRYNPAPPLCHHCGVVLLPPLCRHCAFVLLPLYRAVVHREHLFSSLCPPLSPHPGLLIVHSAVVRCMSLSLSVILCSASHKYNSGMIIVYKACGPEAVQPVGSLVCAHWGPPCVCQIIFQARRPGGLLLHQVKVPGTFSGAYVEVSGIFLDNVFWCILSR